MAIKVSSPKEEHEFLLENPHQCGGSKKGYWVMLKHATTLDLISQHTVMCKNCGYQTVFEFDISSQFPPEAIEIMKKSKKKLYDEQQLKRGKKR